MGLLAFNRIATAQDVTVRGRVLFTLPASTAAGLDSAAVSVTEIVRALSLEERSILEGLRTTAATQFRLEWTGRFPDFELGPLTADVEGGADVPLRVLVATAAALPANTRTGNVLTASANGSINPLNGVTLAVGSRVLVRNEVAGANNGIYRVNVLGSATTPWVFERSFDFDENAEVEAGAQIHASEGTVAPDTLFTLTTNDPIVINTTALAFDGIPAAAAPAGAQYVTLAVDGVLTNERVLTAPAAGLVLTDAGAGSTVTINLANDLAAVEGIAGAGIAVRTGADAWTQRLLAAPAAGITIANPGGVAGDPIFALANDLAAVEGLAATGLAARTAADTWAARTLVQPAAGITIADAGGVAGNPTFALANDLSAYEGLATTGIVVRSAADAAVTRTLVAPAAGITIADAGGVGGNPTFALANDLAAYEGLAANGLVARTADGAASARTITGTASQVTVSNGDGVAGNPTLSLPAAARTGTIPYAKDAADGASTTATAESSIWRAEVASTIISFYFVPDAALTANDTNYATLFLYRRNSSGAAQATIASRSTSITGGTGNWTAFAPVNLGAGGLGNTALAAGEMLAVEITKPGGTGVVVPKGVWVIAYTTD